MESIFILFSTLCFWELNRWVYSSLTFVYEDVPLIFVLFYFLLVFMLLNRIWFNWMNTWEASSGVYSYCSIHLNHRLFLHRWFKSPFPCKGKRSFNVNGIYGGIFYMIVFHILFICLISLFCYWFIQLFLKSLHRVLSSRTLESKDWSP